MEETRKFTRLSNKSPDADVSSARERLPQITGLPGGGPAYTFLADNGSCMGMWFLCNVIFLEKYHFKVSPDFIKNPMWRDVEKVSHCSSVQLRRSPKMPRWRSSEASLLLGQIIGYFSLRIHDSFLRDVSLSTNLMYSWCSGRNSCASGK